MKLILGLSASLRGARHGIGSEELCNSLRNIENKTDLLSFIYAETESLAREYEKAESQGLNQQENLGKLIKSPGNKGLSNSEAALATALWGAYTEGCEINYCNLSKYFPESGNKRHLDELEELILRSGGLLLSGPVYFGDRSSLAQEFIEFLQNNGRCQAHLRGKIYGGIAVGAKRNGGQETCLVYQLLDMINLGMIGVGNDYQSTSQYGGTVVAGDIGTAIKDNYGLDTAIDTGRRVAFLSKELENKGQLQKKCQIQIWLVQDSDNTGLNYIQNIIKNLPGNNDYDLKLYDFTQESIHRCIACDICPIAGGESEHYRCIVTKPEDLFVRYHQELIMADAVLIAAYSPKSKSNTISVYQKFLERTRYLRRDDYVLSNILVSPLIISEVDANQNLHLRMITSLIRHHTAINQPILFFKHNSLILNENEALKKLADFIERAVNFAQTQYACQKTAYNPIGYIISNLRKS